MLGSLASSGYPLFKNKALSEPIKSFCNSGYFLKKGTFLKLRRDIADFITNGFRETLIVVLLKTIHQYFSTIAPKSGVEYSQQHETPNSTQEVNDGPPAHPEKNIDQKSDDKDAPAIVIKKPKRRKIKL